MKVERVDNRKGTGSRILALTDDELEYLIYILRLDDWVTDVVNDPVGHSFVGKVKVLRGKSNGR